MSVSLTLPAEVGQRGSSPAQREEPGCSRGRTGLTCRQARKKEKMHSNLMSSCGTREQLHTGSAFWASSVQCIAQAALAPWGFILILSDYGFLQCHG